jgi:hypothetical protein
MASRSLAMRIHDTTTNEIKRVSQGTFRLTFYLTTMTGPDTVYKLPDKYYSSKATALQITYLRR